MSAHNWIDVRLSEKQELSPILVEHRPAYSVFDCQAFQPRIVLSIGGVEKRHFYRTIGLSDKIPVDAGILLRPLQLATLILDCELHNNSILNSAQQYRHNGEKALHPLQYPLNRDSPPHKISQFAFDMYWQLLFPFASTVLLFVDDLGGVGPVIEILASWAHRARLTTIPCPPRIMILYHWRNRRQMESFESRLQSRIIGSASRGADNARTRLASPIYMQGETAFESLRLVPTWKAASEFQCQTEESFALRDLAGYGFSSDHVKRFFQTAVLQFGQSTGQQIDFYQAVRFRNPLQHQLAERLIRFVSATKDIDLDYVTVIASALELDAHPPDMHFFPPHLTFEKTYRAPLCQAESFLGNGFLEKVCENFIKFSMARHNGSSALAHLRLIERYRSAWRDCTASNVCFVCVVGSASITLGCKHRLCDACAVICGTRDSPASPDIRVTKCPLCGKRNGEVILLQPPTGGNRVLELGGTSANKWTMIKFLKDLQSSIGLPLSLQEHFDLVVGSGIGLFFVQTIFLEGWSLSDCQYHLKNLSDPKVDRRQSLVSFGKNLTWRMGRTASCKGTNMVFIFEGHYSVEQYSAMSPAFRCRDPDFTVRYMGGPYNALSLHFVAQRMLSCLFYIEAASRPALYSPPETILVRLLCRIPPGGEMTSLARNLFQRNTNVRYRGAEATWTAETLVTPTILAHCRNGEPFLKVLRVQINAMETAVDVRLGDQLIGEQSISNCPYKLGKLIGDQGLDCSFGRRDHCYLSGTGNEAFRLQEEIQVLSDELGRFIPSGRQSWI